VFHHAQIISFIKKLSVFSSFVLVACVSNSPPQKPIDLSKQPILPVHPQPAKAALPPPLQADEDGVFRQKSSFDELPGWKTSNLEAAFNAFLASCRKKRESGFQDSVWQQPCRAAFGVEKTTNLDPNLDPNLAYRGFFEQEFTPYSLSLASKGSGLLTAYYEPELLVSPIKTDKFSEPILARPPDLVTVSLRRMDTSLPDKRLSGLVKNGQLQPYYTRKEIRRTERKTLAWGRPIDVFFLQIQGSGRIRYPDGIVARAAFSGHNGQPYHSIGRELIRRGELAKGKASKSAIENWMHKAESQAVQELMNTNPRYVFFEKQTIFNSSTGPKGTQGVGLTAKASIAVDTAYHSFGSPIWIDSRLPQSEKDWTGKETQFLAIAQDTGGAIKGALRGDLFYGSGEQAGKLAGIQKHPARWWTLMPNQQSKMRDVGA